MEKATIPDNPSIWPIIIKLLRLRILIFVNNIKRAKLRQKISLGFLGALLLGFLGFVFYISWLMLQGLRSPMLSEVVGDISDIIQMLPTLLLSGAFIGILVTSFGVLLQALYLAGDMDFLLAAPIPIRAVFVTKLLQAILPNFALICVFALPVLFGLGVSQSYSVFYYPLVIILLIGLSLAAAGISSLLVMLAARIFPARRMVEVLGFIGGITSIICSQSGQLARFEEFSPDQAGQAYQALSRIDLPWSPLTWAGNGLTLIGQGDWVNGALLLSLTLLLAVGTFSITLATAERLYYSGWASIQGQKKKKKSVRANKVARNIVLQQAIEKLVPAGLRSIMVKDFIMLQRDLRNLSQLVTPLIFGIIYAFLLLRDGNEFSNGSEEIPEFFLPAFENISVYFTVGIALLVSWMLIGRLGGMGFSQEGKSYWLLKTAPLDTRTLVAAKFLVAYIPVILLSGGFLVILSLIQGLQPSQLVFTLPVIALCIAGNVGLSLTFGITGAKLDWEDPRQMQKTGSGCLGALAAMVYLPISLVLFFIPPLVAQFFDLPTWIGQVLGLIIGGTFSLTCAILPLWLVRQTVKRLGEI
ncbi:MAG TPA: hypothetical protein VLM80_11040 [Anaerolineales bacterium]|nr:hypothetical protein [Anaerolineales bacterium]